MRQLGGTTPALRGYARCAMYDCRLRSPRPGV